jgi:hypothetical protein
MCSPFFLKEKNNGCSTPDALRVATIWMLRGASYTTLGGADRHCSSTGITRRVFRKDQVSAANKVGDGQVPMSRNETCHPPDGHKPNTQTPSGIEQPGKAWIGQPNRRRSRPVASFGADAVADSGSNRRLRRREAGLRWLRPGSLGFVSQNGEFGLLLRR